MCTSDPNQLPSIRYREKIICHHLLPPLPQQHPPLYRGQLTQKHEVYFPLQNVATSWGVLAPSEHDEVEMKIYTAFYRQTVK